MSKQSTDRADTGAGGFSLVEVLLALFLLGLGVLAAAPMFMYAVQGNAVGADYGTVGAVAVDRMETLRSLPFHALVVGGSITTDQTGYVDLSDPDHIVRWRILNSGTPSVKTIVVRVIATREVVGRAKEVTLLTMRGRE
jgi:hypothetical protein